MNSQNEAVKSFVGQCGPVEFHVPFEDMSGLNYETKFGLQPDFIRNTGLEVQSSTASLKLKAAFNGQLFFYPYTYSGKANHILHLIIFPIEVMTMRLTLKEDIASPVEIYYQPVNEQKVAEAMKNVLKSQKFSEESSKKFLADFLSDNHVGIPVKAGQDIGQTINQSLHIEISSVDGHLIHPVYLFFHWWKTGQGNPMQFKPDSHSLIKDLKLNSLDLEVDNNLVIDKTTSTSLGPYTFL